MIAHIPASVRASLEDVADANPGWKVERDADGALRLSPTGTLSGAHDAALMWLLLEWSRGGAGGVVFGSSTGFTMPDGSLLSPDASWIADERWHATDPQQRIGYLAIVPDVCIEIVSATDRVGDVTAKLARYRNYGAAFVALIDPFRRRTWSDGTPPPDFPSDFTSVYDAGS
jgi:Uma2 family endonuclease